MTTNLSDLILTHWDTLSVAIDAADKSAAVTRSLLQKVRDVDSVFRAFAEAQERKKK